MVYTMALLGHPRSLILAPIESAYATSYWSPIVTLVPILLRFSDIACFLLSDPTLIPPDFWGVPLGLDCRCCGSEERRTAAIRLCGFNVRLL